LARFGERAGADALEGADACVVDVRDDDRDRLGAVQHELADRFELAVRIETEDHLEFVLEEFDPEILVLAASAGGGHSPLERVLELLPDVPAGKLAIADIGAGTRDEVEELERAGMDGVIVAAGHVAHLGGAAPPEVWRSAKGSRLGPPRARPGRPAGRSSHDPARRRAVRPALLAPRS